MNKNALQNDQLIQDLKREAWADDVIKALRSAKITTYQSLFALIRDNSRNPQLRADICEEIRRLYVWIDRRRFVPPLLEALKTDYEPLLQNAIQALANLKSKRAIIPVIKLVNDKRQSYETRRLAILALTEGIGDVKAIPALLSVMIDHTDDIKVREDAIEHTAWFSDPSLVTPYTQLLSDPDVDMRFWAAYGFAIMRVDISSALNELDQIAAYDHNAPDGWWHVDREAFNALENIYWRALGLRDTETSHEQVHIISPAPEYTTFEWRFNRWPYQEYKKLAPPTLKVGDKWFTEKLLTGWANIKLNIRQPKPETYLVDWLIEIDNEPLIGGLHRDQYTIVLTGSLKAVNLFAAWYRSIIDPKQYLFLYEWAGLAVEIKPETNTEDMIIAQKERSQHMNAMDERGINYPWVIETD